MDYFINKFQIFLLVIVRITGMFIAAPFFSSFSIPFSAKVLLSFLTTIIIFPVVGSIISVTILHPIQYALLIINEFLIGLIIGFTCALFFVIFQQATQFFSIQIGLGISELLDPITQEQVPLFGQFFSLVALLIFLNIDGHHFLIRGVYNSYKILPYLSINKAEILNTTFVKIISDVFRISLQIALPVIGTMFIISVGLGILAKAAPQMNILLLGFPIQIGIGIISIMVISAALVDNMSNIFHLAINKITEVIKILR